MLEVAVNATSTIHCEEKLKRNFNYNSIRMPSPLEEAYISHRNVLYSVIFNVVRSHEDTEELLQDTFIRAIKGYDNFRGDAKIETWLHRIAFNLARNKYWYHKRRAKDRTVSIDAPLIGKGEDEDGDYSDVVSYLKSHARSVTADIEAQELVRRAKKGINLLSPIHQKTLKLRMREKTYLEIAEATDTTVGTVKSRIARAREVLIRRIYGTERERGFFSVYG